MTNRFAVESGLSEAGEGHLEQLLDQLEMQEGGRHELPVAEWDYASQLTRSQRAFWAQKSLARVLGPWVPQTGMMDRATRRAIGIFQVQRRLLPTGRLDADTLAALQSALKAQATYLGGLEQEWETPSGTSPLVPAVQIQDNLPAIFFKRDSIEIRQDVGVDSVIHLLHAFLQMQQFVKQKSPLAHVILHGFASKEGEITHNRTLSQKSADRVKQVMVEGGIPAEQITAVGHGVGNLVPVQELNRVVAIERK